MSVELEHWLKDIKTYQKRITPEVERELIDQYQAAKSPAKQNKVLEEILRYHGKQLCAIVLSVLNSFKDQGSVSELDLLHTALLLFIQKLNNFDPEKNTQLNTYYTRAVRTELYRYLIKYSMPVRRGSHQYQVYVGHITTFVEAYKKNHDGQPPDVEKIARYMMEDKDISRKLFNRAYNLYKVDNAKSFEDIDTYKEARYNVPEASEDFFIENVLQTIKQQLDLTNSEISILDNCMEKGEPIPLNLLNKLGRTKSNKFL